MSADDRTDSSNDKYKMFRNYMVNELGITRQDIEAWTKQSVANEVSKVIGKINITDEHINTLAKNEIARYVKQSFGDIDRYGQNNSVAKAVVKELVKGLELRVK